MSERTKCSAQTQHGRPCSRWAQVGKERCGNHERAILKEQQRAQWAASAAAAQAAAAAALVQEKAELKLKVVCDPDPEQTMAEDTARWLWVEHREAFCQATREGEIAVVCECTACQDDMNHIPVCSQHCSCCQCKDCVCAARRKTRRFDPDAGAVQPYWDSACQCDSCTEDIYDNPACCSHCGHACGH